MSAIAQAYPPKAPTTKLDHDVVAVRTVSLTATTSSIAGAQIPKAPTTKLDHDVVAVKTVSLTATMSSIVGAHLSRAPQTANPPIPNWRLTIRQTQETSNATGVITLVITPLNALPTTDLKPETDPVSYHDVADVKTV